MPLSDKNPLRILFFGTPLFSLSSLEIVWASKQCVGIVTRPDSRSGRGWKLLSSPVKQFALERELSIFQPEKLGDPAFLEAVGKLRPTLMLVVAYGKFIPKALRKKFSLCVNFHPSLLPRHRGAAPIVRAILKGEGKTGVTAHLVVDKLDAGDILWQEEVPIAPEETAGSLSHKLSELTAKGVRELLSLVEQDRLHSKPQDEREATYAPSLQRHEEKIYWSLPCEIILNQIRAFAPSPGAYTLYNGRRLKILSASSSTLSLSPGRAAIQKGQCYVGTETKAIQLKKVQLEGKQKTSIEAFCHGVREKNFFLG